VRVKSNADNGIRRSPPGRPGSLRGTSKNEGINRARLEPGSSKSTVRNRPLVDGNKRLAPVADVVIYGINGLALRAPEDPAYELVISIAEVRVTCPEAAAQARWLG